MHWLILPLLMIGETEPARLSLDTDRWQEHAQIQKRAKWGLENLCVVDAPAGLQGDAPKCLRVLMPKGSASPTAERKFGAPLGGGQFIATLGIKPIDRATLSYRLRFAENFDFVKGGKLPGLCGGSVNSGKHIPDGTNGFSTRFMWRRGGQGEVYAYLPTSEEHGTSLGRGRWRFTPGKWHSIEQQVSLNDPGSDNGRIVVKLDDREVLVADRLRFRTVGTLRIEGLFFSAFFGGDDLTWSTPADTHIDFADFELE